MDRQYGSKMDVLVQRIAKAVAETPMTVTSADDVLWSQMWNDLNAVSMAYGAQYEQKAIATVKKEPRLENST